MDSEAEGRLSGAGSVSACSVATAQRQGRISIAATALQNCTQLLSQKLGGDAAQNKNKTFPNISLHLLHNREHHGTITPKSKSIKCASS